MKKFVVLFLACMLFGASVCSAEILNQKDEFTGGTTNISRYHHNPKISHKLEEIYLYKTKANQQIDYKIEVRVRTIQRFGLSNKIVQINVNGDWTVDLPVLNMQAMPIDWKYLYIANYQTPQDVIDRIKTANRVALKFTQNDGSQFVFVLPDNVLAEWKEVIAMEK